MKDAGARGCASVCESNSERVNVCVNECAMVRVCHSEFVCISVSEGTVTIVCKSVWSAFGCVPASVCPLRACVCVSTLECVRVCDGASDHKRRGCR